MPSMMAWIDGISVKLKVGLNCMMNIVIDQMGTQNFFMLLKIHLKKIQSYNLTVTNTWSTDQRKKLSEQILKCYAKSAGQATSSKYVFFAIVFKTQLDNLLSQYFMLLLLPFVLSEVIMGFSWGLATSVMALTVRSVSRWRYIRLMRGLKYNILSLPHKEERRHICLQLR